MAGKVPSVFEAITEKCKYSNISIMEKSNARYIFSLL